MIFEIKKDIENTIDLIKSNPRISSTQIQIELEKIIENIDTKKKSRPIPIPYAKYDRNNDTNKHSQLDPSLIEERLDREREKLKEKWKQKEIKLNLEKNGSEDDFFFFDLE